MDALSAGEARPTSEGPSALPGGPDDRLLFWPQVKAITGLSRTTVWRMQKAAEFPGSVQVSRGRVGWWESELALWKRTRTPGRWRPSPGVISPGATRPAQPLAPSPPSPPDTRRLPEAGPRVLAGPSVGPTPPMTSRGRGPRRRTASDAQIAFDFGAP